MKLHEATSQQAQQRFGSAGCVVLLSQHIHIYRFVPNLKCQLLCCQDNRKPQFFIIKIFFVPRLLLI